MQHVTIDHGTIAYSRVGTGYPLLLLHGYPETHIAWHKITHRLAQQFTVIAADLPGYGDSVWPISSGENGFTKRSMAAALISFMERLGFESFNLAGHDRGGRVAYRMALDHPERINRLAVLDIVPTLEVMLHLDYTTALEMHNWLFLAQPLHCPNG